MPRPPRRFYSHGPKNEDNPQLDGPKPPTRSFRAVKSSQTWLVGGFEPQSWVQNFRFGDVVVTPGGPLAKRLDGRREQIYRD
jgi:hypothetical protein